MQLIRSFLGAAFCAFASLWPALHFNIPWLLAPFGIVGWMIGYHSDRLYLGLRYGAWEFGDKAQQTWSVASGYASGFWQRSVSISSAFGHGVLAVLRWIGRMIWAAPSAAGTASAVAWRGYWSRFNHPMTNAYRIRILIYGGAFLAIVFYIWQQNGSFGAEVGDLRRVGISHPAEYKAVTADYAFSEDVMLTFLMSIPALIATLLGIGRSSPTNRTEFYAAYNRYCELGTVRYAAIELFDCVRTFSFIGVAMFAIVCFFAGLGVSLVIIGIPLSIIFGFAFVGLPILYGASQMMWCIAKADEDYGLGSLGIGLAIATITYFTQSSAGAEQQLITSFTAGLLAGTLSIGVTAANRLVGDIRLSTPRLDQVLEESKIEKFLDRLGGQGNRAMKSFWGLINKLLPPDRLATA